MTDLRRTDAGRTDGGRPDAVPTRSVARRDGPRTPTFPTAGTTVTYDDEGTGSPTILCLHGFSANRHSFALLAPALAERARVLVPDRPGWGDTPLPVGDDARRAVLRPAGEARMWLDLADQLDIGSLLLVGHSAGGAVAAELALLAPDRVAALVLLDAAIDDRLGPSPAALALAQRPGVNAAGRRVMAAVAPATWRWFLRVAYADPTRIHPEVLQAYGESLAQPSWAETMWEMARLAEPDDLPARVARITVPTLVVTGRHDRVVPPSVSHRLADDIPGANLVIIAEAGHNPHEEQPAEVLAAIEPLLEDGREPSGPA